SSLQTHNVNRCGRSRHLARKLSLRRKRSSPNVFEMAATETITSIILIKLIRVSLGTVRHPRRFKIVVIDIQITRSEERFSRNAETDLVCRLLLEKKKKTFTIITKTMFKSPCMNLLFIHAVTFADVPI